MKPYTQQTLTHHTLITISYHSILHPGIRSLAELVFGQCHLLALTTVWNVRAKIFDAILHAATQHHRQSDDHARTVSTHPGGSIPENCSKQCRAADVRRAHQWRSCAPAL
ncbi:hypothetical protein DAEQUDRAFT_721586, partial [Daedalea quercina L-15889]